ncbi:MAG: pyridoxal phosphate-dependent aminotransferase, partial [Proteiniphilum sp.]|nr:pyridoxal phosphate-dependent aminotransferase [Proteiniphilum sp.]
MPEISQRGVQMPASPIRKLAPLSDAAKAEGVKVYHLNIGQPDLPSPVTALDAIRAIDRTTREYSPSDGYRYYRENLTRYYKKYDIDLTPEQIIVTAGGS